MRGTFTGLCAAAALLLAASVASAEVVRDTLMLRAKDSQAKLVAIGDDVFHVTASTKFVAWGRTSSATSEKLLSLAELPVPESAGAVVPAGEPGVMVKYEAKVVGNHLELVHAIVYPKGSRPR